MPYLLWPVEGRITQHFAVNENSYPSTPIGHMGTDVSAVVGTPIYAATDGIVQWVDYDSGWGNYVRVLYPDYGFHGLYAHMRERYGDQGDLLNQGDLIGYTGNTGWSTGPHLHYSVRLADPDASSHQSYDPDDTDPYLGTSANPYGYVDPILFHGYINNMPNFSQGNPGNDGLFRRISDLEDRVKRMAEWLRKAGGG